MRRSRLQWVAGLALSALLLGTLTPTSTGGPAQAAQGDPIKLTISIENDGDVWGTYLTGDVCVEVNWGDEDSGRFTSAATPTHTYTTAGDYQVTIGPGAGCTTYPYLDHFGKSGESEYNDLIVSVESFGDLGITSLTDAFRGATSLTTVPNTLPDTVVSLEGTFLGASIFNQDISGWLPPGNNVEFTHEMFEQAHAFNQDLSDWDVSGVKNMDEMFDGNGTPMAFNQDLSDWDFSGLDREWDGQDDDPLFQFVHDTSLDRANYSALLQRWEEQKEDLPNIMEPGTLAATYTCTAKTSRDALEEKSWSFDDGGLYLSAPSIDTVTSSGTSLSVAFTAPDCADSVTDYQYSTDGGSTWTTSESTTSPLSIPSPNSGQAFTLGLRAVSTIPGEESTSTVGGESSSSTSSRSKEDDATVPAPVAAPTSPTAATTAPNSALRPSPFLYGDSVFLPGAGALGPVREPFKERDGVFSPPEAPTISANESFGAARAEVVTNLTEDGPIIGDLVSFLSLGNDDLTVGLQTALGTQTGASGAPELWAPRGGELEFAGEGLRPGSAVQIFLGFAEDGSAEFEQVTVSEDGSFAGSAALESLDPPLPIGRHLLQIVAVDPGGNRVIIDVAAVIVPPAEPRFEVDALTAAPPALEPGGVLATREGEPATASVIRETENAVTAIIGEEDDPQGSATFQGSSVEETESVPQMVVFPNDDPLGVSVTDWRPNTPAHVWIFSEPTLLGTFTTNDEGQFEGEFTIDGDTIAVGQHTLQVQGIDRDGYTQSINLGILVGEATTAPAATQDSMSIGWLWWMLGAVGLAALIVLGFWLLSRRRSA